MYITPSENRKIGKVYINLVDILYAIVLAQGFVYLSSNSGFFSWITSGDIISIWNTLNAYTLVVGSWIRYHASVENYPEGSLRFVIDVILMFLYYLAFVKASSALITVAIFVIVFSLYSVWSALRIREYPESRRSVWTFGIRLSITFTFLCLILGISGYFHFFLTPLRAVPLFLWIIVTIYTLLPYIHFGEL